MFNLGLAILNLVSIIVCTFCTQVFLDAVGSGVQVQSVLEKESSLSMELPVEIKLQANWGL